MNQHFILDSGHCGRGPAVQDRTVPSSYQPLSAAKIVIAFLLASLLAAGIQQAFLSQIGDFSPGAQETYIIDAYYYMYLGDLVVRQTGGLGPGFSDYVHLVSPNEDSVGIIYLNALIAAVLPSRECLPFLFGAIYALIFLLLSKFSRLDSKLLFMPFGGLAPYLFVPSKEAFIVLGLLLILISFVEPKLFLFGIFGSALMYAARPGAFYLLTLSYVVWQLAQRRVLRAPALIAILAGYALAGRYLCFDWSSEYQQIAFAANTGFCNVGPLSVCVGSSRFVEWIYLQRLLSLALLPLKWLWDFGGLFGGADLPSWIIRTSIVAHLLWLFGVLCARSHAWLATSKQTRTLLLYFSVIYISAFGAILYYQPTRQILLATTLAAIGCSVTPLQERDSKRHRNAILRQLGPCRDCSAAAG